MIARLLLSLQILGIKLLILTILRTVLGLDTAESARKLVHLLLADPLGEREAWEDIIEESRSDSTRGLLIRYDRMEYIDIFQALC